MKSNLMILGVAALLMACSQANQNEAQKFESPAKESEEAYAASEEPIMEADEEVQEDYHWYKPLGEQKIQELFDLALIAADPDGDAEMIAAAKEAMRTIWTEDEAQLEEFIASPLFLDTDSGKLENLVWADLRDNSTPMGMVTAEWVTPQGRIPFSFFYGAQKTTNNGQQEVSFSIGRIDWKGPAA